MINRCLQLLLRKSGDATPLLHAMRIGQSHRDVAIILLGSFSRYVNHLQDDEVGLPQTKKLLKALRKIFILFSKILLKNDLDRYKFETGD